MANFQQTPKPRNYLARREQWRLLLLFLALGLVAVMISLARDPANFAWFAALDKTADGLSKNLSGGDQTPVDNRLEPAAPREEVPGTFVSPLNVTSESEPTGTSRYFPGVRPELLTAIADDTIFRYDERHAWFNLLDVLNKAQQEGLRRASTGRASYAQLFKQSGDYRGELVTVVGTIRRAHPITAPRNDYGIEKYYQTWLQPDDNRASPMVVYCLKLPDGFPTGMHVAEEVEITGFFFKRWAYRARDSLRTAPTLLAQTVDWRRRAPAAGRGPTDTFSLLMIFGAALILSLSAVSYVYFRTRSPRPSRPPGPDIPIAPE